MTLLDSNLRVLRERLPELARRLEESGGDSAAGLIHVATASSGHPTLVAQGVYLHSSYDPLKEASSLVERGAEADASACIALGFGLGYLAEAYVRRYPGIPLLVVEPDAAVFRAALSARDLAPLLASPHVSLLVGESPESVSRILPDLPLERPWFLRLRPSVEKNQGYFRSVEEILQSYLLRRDINANTLARFGRLWIRNLARNLARFVDAPGVSLLEGRFSGLPAVVLGAGPSLDLLSGALKDVSLRAILVAVNTSLKPTLEAGVEPDFVVAVDPQYWASRYLDWAPTSECLFVAEPSTHPRLLRREAPYYVSSSLFPLGEKLEAALGRKGKLGAGGSVATSAWDLCRHFGANPIYAAGLDLGFPGMRTHCRGAFFEDLWFSLSDRLAPLESSSFRYLREIGIFPIRSASDGLTMTDRRMLLYKWWFESQIASEKRIAAFTLSPGSVRIEGMPLASVEEILDRPVVRPRIDELKRELRSRTGGEQAAAGRRGAFLAAVNGIVEDLASLERLADDGIAHTERLARILSSGGDTRHCLGKLDEIDRRILGLASRDIAGFLVQSTISKVASGDGKKLPEGEVLARSREIYSGLSESAGFQRKILLQTREVFAKPDG